MDFETWYNGVPVDSGGYDFELWSSGRPFVNSESLVAVEVFSSVLWSVLEFVQKEQAASWSLIGAVSAEFGYSWSVLGTVAIGGAVSWSALAGVVASASPTWSVLQGVTVQSESTWSELAQVQAQQGAQWSVLTLVPASSQAHWSQLASVQAAKDATWQVLFPVQDFVVVQWDALAVVSAQTLATWSLLYGVTAESEVTWEVAAGGFLHEEAAMTSWQRFLARYFDGQDHTVSDSNLAFPAANLAFQQSAIAQGLQIRAVMIHRGETKKTNWLGQAAARYECTWTFMITANREEDVRSAADLLYAICLRQRGELAKLGLLHIEPQPPVPLSNSEKKCRTMTASGMRYFVRQDRE